MKDYQITISGEGGRVAFQGFVADMPSAILQDVLTLVEAGAYKLEGDVEDVAERLRIEIVARSL